MERPSTSKPRGICRYYTAPRGCFAGKNCKFLHGENEKHTPFDQNKICNFYRAGYCRRGADCWFRHVGESKGPPSQTSDEDLHCSVCYEQPITYALLIGCSHVFCLQCIRQWRGSSNKTEDVVSSETAKSCPYCRVSSKFITPSSQFFPEGDPRKDEIIARYKASMARVPCRYFQKSSPTRRRCPFGRDCFYQHVQDDGTPYVFTGGAEENMNSRTLNWPPLTNFEDINATLAELRSNLPSLFGFNMPAHADRILNLGMLQDLTALYGYGDPAMHGEGAARPVSPQDLPTETNQEHETSAAPDEEPETPYLVSTGLDTYSGLSSPTSTSSSDDSILFLLPTADPDHLETENPDQPSAASISRIHSGIVRQQVDTTEPALVAPSSVETPAGDSTQLEAEEASSLVDGGATSSLTAEAFDEPSAGSTPVYHNPNPPFATDGRGRVVWSNRGGRDTQSSQPVRPTLARKARTDDAEGGSPVLMTARVGNDRNAVVDRPEPLPQSAPSLEKSEVMNEEDASRGSEGAGMF